MSMVKMRGAGRRRSATLALALVTTMALVGAACTPPPPLPADKDVVIVASQQPDGIANYLNLTLPTSEPFSYGLEVDPDRLIANVKLASGAVDLWYIECSGPSIDNGDGSFSCPADLEFTRIAGVDGHVYRGQGLLSTWPDAAPRYAAYVGTTTYVHTWSFFDGTTQDPERVGQTWTEELRIQDGDDTMVWPRLP